MMGIVTPTLRKRLRGQNMSMKLGLIELTELSDTLNYKPFLNITFYKLFYTHFYCLYLCGKNSFVLKIELCFTLFYLV